MGPRALVLSVGVMLAAACDEGQAPRSVGQDSPWAAEPALAGMSAEELEMFVILAGAQAGSGGLPPGRWRTTDSGELPPVDDSEREVLQALGYVDGSMVAGSESGVTTYREGEAQEGLNLYTSGHAPEARLIDMDGQILHRWSYPMRDAWPEAPESMHSRFWRRVHASSNGDLLAVFEGYGILKLDRDSRLLWARRGGYHHEVVVTEDGRVFTLRRSAQLVPGLDPQRPALVDSVVVLDAQGAEQDSFSLLDAMRNSDFAHLLEPMRRHGDLFHTNSVHVCDGREAGGSALFAQGNLIVSFLALNVLAIIDPSQRRAVWAAGGRWRRQHDPTPQANGAMLLFDNRGNRGKSRVLLIDVATTRERWSYTGSEGELFSRTCGTARRLSGGNILITESDRGRALEIRPDGRLVWEFLNPHRAGENDRLVATLFELERLSWSRVPWLEGE